VNFFLSLPLLPVILRTFFRLNIFKGLWAFLQICKKIFKILVQFLHLDPNPDPATRINANPDPKPCILVFPFVNVLNNQIEIWPASSLVVCRPARHTATLCCMSLGMKDFAYKSSFSEQKRKYVILKTFLTVR
jgi:hypothetical protein